MKAQIFTLFWGASIGLCFIASVRAEAMEKCVARNHTYNIGDNKQCDKYYECTTLGKSNEKLCPDGYVYSFEITNCEFPHNVDCSKRPMLQPSQSKIPQCPRSNGFYAYPAEVSCQQFYHCLEGQAYEKSCPEGVIFDPSKGTCVHPDLASRSECSAQEALNFSCPNALERYTKLKFGDHERYSHPSDCRKFFICLKDGKPRSAGCPFGKVFNGKTGYCDLPKFVPSCKDYYKGKKNPESFTDEDDSERFGVDDDEDISEENNSEEKQQQPKGKKLNQKPK